MADCTRSNDFLQPATLGKRAGPRNDASLVDAPTLLDPALTTNVLIGTCRVWRGPAGSGSTWNSANALSPPLNGSATPCTAASALIRSLAAGGPTVTSINAQNSGSTVLYAGIAGALDGGGNIPGHVFVTTSANTRHQHRRLDRHRSLARHQRRPRRTSSTPATSTSPHLAADPHDATGGTIYAAIDGFG